MNSRSYLVVSLSVYFFTKAIIFIQISNNDINHDYYKINLSICLSQMYIADQQQAHPFRSEELLRLSPRARQRNSGSFAACPRLLGHVTRSSSRSSKKTRGYFVREFLGIPPITLPVSTLTRPFLRFRARTTLARSPIKRRRARRSAAFI